jgi:cysteine-rich repeat protein
MTNRLDVEIDSSTKYGLGVYRRPAEAVIIGGAAAARQESDRSIASPTLYEVMGSSLDGRTIDGLPINGKRLRNNTDLSSSSFLTTLYSPSLSNAGRLNSSVPWIPAQQTPYEYVQVTFPSATLVSHIATRGGGMHGSWVTQYKISTSIDGVTWKYYSTNGEGAPKIFQANNDISTVVRHQLLGKFAIYSVFGSGGKSQVKKEAPLLARMFRIYPVMWNSTIVKEKKIALRFELLRRVECGDGFWDEMNEGCDDGNVISGDGCSGTSGDWRGTPGPCQPEMFTTEYYDTLKAPQRHLDGVDSGHTVEKSRVPPHPKKLTQWCHSGSDCYDCASQQVSSPTMKYDSATQEYYLK